MNPNATPRPGYVFRHYGPDGAQIVIEVPNPDQIQEQIDFIRWVVGDMLAAQALDTVASEARNARPDLFSNTDDITAVQSLEADLSQREEELAIAKERIAELEAREPEVRIVEKIVERVVEAAAPVVEEAVPYTPDFTLIPDALAKFAEADETAADFRNRLKRLWQRFGIADGENFPGGGEPLSGEEKITMREIDIVLNSDEGRNAGLLQWLQADERNT